MDNTFSMKTIKEACLKTTNKLEINGKVFEPGEVIAYFNEIDFAFLDGSPVIKKASGGFDNRGLVFWENLKEVRVDFLKGVFSKEQFGILCNSKVIYKQSSDTELVSYREYLESNENGKATLKYVPAGNIFVYKKATGEKLPFTLEEKELTIEPVYTDLIVDYVFNYNNASSLLTIGNNLINGFVSFEGKTEIKDDKTGVVHTGIIRIPKMKLVSQLAIHLGNTNDPIVANFRGLAQPVGVRGDSRVIEFLFLEDDLYSDF